MKKPIDESTYLKIMEELCGSEENKWNETLESAKELLQFRMKLWDGVMGLIKI